MKYLFFLNEAKHPVEGYNLGWLGGYKDEHVLSLELAYRGTISDRGIDPRTNMPQEQKDHYALGWLFEKFNIDHPKDYRQRSMSVGDVIALWDGTEVRAYAVEGMGWKRIHIPDQKALTELLEAIYEPA